jgi:hypothetical protein
MSEREMILRMRHSQGLKLIAQKKASKEPIMPYLRYIENPDLQQSWDEIYDNLLRSSSIENNIALLLGKTSNGTLCVDFDDKLLFQGFWGDMLDGLLSRTLVEESYHGFHTFFCDPTVDFTKIDFRRSAAGSTSLPLEIKANRTLVTIYPSIHESGILYRVVSKTQKIMYLDGVVELVIQKAKELGWKPLESDTFHYANLTQITSGGLTFRQKNANELSQIISKIWKEHHHHAVIVGSAGMLLRAGVSEVESAQFLESVTKEMGCKQHCWRTAKSQVSAIYKSSRNNSSHVPGVTTLASLGQSFNLPEISQRALLLNHTLMTQRKAREDIRNWMTKHGY